MVPKYTRIVCNRSPIRNTQNQKKKIKNIGVETAEQVVNKNVKYILNTDD